MYLSICTIVNYLMFFALLIVFFSLMFRTTNVVLTEIKLYKYLN